MREEGLSEEELAAVIKSYVFDLEYSRDQPEALAVRYGWGVQADYLRTLDLDIQELHRLRPEDLQRVSRRFLRSKALKLVVVGPWSEQNRQAIETLLVSCPLDGQG